MDKSEKHRELTVEKIGRKKIDFLSKNQKNEAENSFQKNIYFVNFIIQNDLNSPRVVEIINIPLKR